MRWLSLVVVLAVLLSASPVVAAELVELPREWALLHGDDPAWAAELDDSAWPRFEPSVGIDGEKHPEMLKGGIVWFRNRVTGLSFPPGEPVSITIGSTTGAYDLYVDGIRIGGAGSVDGQENGPIAPLAHRVPAEVLADGALTIAVRTWQPSGMENSIMWRRLRYAPRVVGVDAAVAQRIELEQHRVFETRALHGVIMAVIELLLCLYHFHLAFRRRELDVYFWYAVAMGVFAFGDGFMEVVFPMGWIAGFGPELALRMFSVFQGAAMILLVELIVRFATAARPGRVWRAFQVAIGLPGLFVACAGSAAFHWLPEGGVFIPSSAFPVLAVFVLWQAWRKKSRDARAVGWALLATMAFLGGTTLLQRAWIAPYATVFLNIALAVVLSNHFGRTLTELSDINRAIARFVPYPFLDLLGKQSIREVQRGDNTEVEIAILFSDIRGFTTMAEGMGPAATFAFINDYIARMAPAIHREGGFINDIFGDGIMALFHRGPDAAMKAAMQMLAALEKLNEERGEGEPRLRMGIGIHTGRLMLGTIGDHERLDCTVIGDPANTASRVEGMTKEYGATLLISDATYRALERADRYEVREIDSVVARGRAAETTLYEVLDGDARRDAKLRTRDAFAAALARRRAEDWPGALAGFRSVIADDPDDAAAKLHLGRIESQIAATA